MSSSQDKFSVGVVGLGTMGSGIAQLAATHGHQVLMYDAFDVMRTKAKGLIDKNLAKLKERGKLSEKEASTIASRLKVIDSLLPLAECNVVIEAVSEDLEIKRKLFAELDTITPETTLLCTNTSSLSVSAVVSNCRHRGRMLGLHFFNPAQVMPLVEIVPTAVTALPALLRAKTAVESWGKVAVVAQDTPGFIVNRIARPFYGEALRIHEENIADIATIDWAMKEIGGFRMGPFELMDFIGNDINLKVSESVFTAFYYEPRFRPSLLQRRMVDSGFLGRKVGRGFYDYSPGVEPPKPNEDQKLGETIFNRIISMLINEAADALYMGVASREDIDLAMEKGVNYPKGLLGWADELGVKTVLSNITSLNAHYEEDRYRPCPLLKTLAREGRSFFDKKLG